MAKVKKEYGELAQKAVKGARRFSGGVDITFRVFVKNRRTDGGNVRSIVEKFSLDGMVKGKLFKDDRIEFIRHDEAFYDIDKDNPRVEIEIKSKKHKKLEG